MKFGGLCYDVLGLSRLNGTDKIINLVFQIRFPVLRDTPQHISYNIYATFDIVSAISRNVSRRSEAENKKMISLKKKYENNANVILCDSLQSIDYWFLLHFEDTCRHFQDSAATERALKQYLPTHGSFI